MRAAGLYVTPPAVSRRPTSGRTYWLSFLYAALALHGCAAGQESGRAAPEAGWQVLFDGTDLSQWRGYQREAVPPGWRAEEGALTLVPGGEQRDLITRNRFGDFELEYEWKISEGGNSGVIYRVTEDRPRSWHTGVEMQILDDQGYLGKLKPDQLTGAIYELVAPPPGVTRPAGEWNRARIVARGNRLEHWLNGRLVGEIDVGSEQWNDLIAASKFREHPGFGRNRIGHVVLQDHGDPVWYRNIRIRPLEQNR